MAPPRARLGRWFGLIVLGNAAVVFVMPGLLSFPTGPFFLLDALPVVAFVEVAAAVFALARAVGMGPPRPLGATAIFALGTLLLALANVYLWIMCCVSAA